MSFQKNRNGKVEQELSFELSNKNITYGFITGNED